MIGKIKLDCKIDVIVILIFRGKVFLFLHLPQVFSKSGIELTASFFNVQDGAVGTSDGVDNADR